MDVKFRMTDLRRTVFENCAFTGVDFTYSDLRGQRLDGATFTSVKFDNAALDGVSFRGATLRMCPSALRAGSTSARWPSMGRAWTS